MTLWRLAQRYRRAAEQQKYRAQIFSVELLSFMSALVCA
jgi:hypothetical protein